MQAPAASTVVRSVAWDSGWSATVSVNGGKPHDIAVHDFNLVQQVHIPAGNDIVTFHYRPPHLLAASVLSVGGVALLVVLLAVSLVRRRRATGPTFDADEESGGVVDVPAPDGMAAPVT